MTSEALETLRKRSTWCPGGHYVDAGTIVDHVRHLCAACILRETLGAPRIGAEVELDGRAWRVKGYGFRRLDGLTRCAAELHRHYRGQTIREHISAARLVDVLASADSSRAKTLPSENGEA